MLMPDRSPDPPPPALGAADGELDEQAETRIIAAVRPIAHFVDRIVTPFLGPPRRESTPADQSYKAYPADGREECNRLKEQTPARFAARFATLIRNLRCLNRQPPRRGRLPSTTNGPPETIGKPDGRSRPVARARARVDRGADGGLRAPAGLRARPRRGRVRLAHPRIHAGRRRGPVLTLATRPARPGQRWRDDSRGSTACDAQVSRTQAWAGSSVIRHARSAPGPAMTFR